MDVLSDRYELGAPLGAGGMATVVEALDRLLDRPVAVKLMRQDLSTDPSVRERFLREARSAARFNHPNAVAVYDTGEDGRQPWIVMELVRGRNLADRLAAEGALDPTDAVRIADAVLAALGAAHAAGMVHRDVKPANILLPDDGGVKLSDFGIAKSVQDAAAGLTATGHIVGTAKYLSPEQVDGKPATPASDVYATGVVLYEMLAGEPPFTGDTAIAIALAHTRDDPPPLQRRRRGLDPGLVAVVDRALMKDPQRRFHDAQAMRDALAGKAAAAATVPLPSAVAAAAPTAVLPPRRATTRAVPAAPPPASSRLPFVLAGLVALLIVGLLAYNALSGPGGQEQPRDSSPTEADAPEPEPTEEQLQPAPTEPAQDEPPATEAPESEAAPEPTASDLPGLIDELDASPGAFGEQQEELRSELAAVLEAPDASQQAQAASRLQEKAAEWARDGGLDPRIGALAVALLVPYAQQTSDDEDGEARGKGKDKDKDKDD